MTDPANTRVLRAVVVIGALGGLFEGALSACASSAPDVAGGEVRPAGGDAPVGVAAFPAEGASVRDRLAAPPGDSCNATTGLSAPLTTCSPAASCVVKDSPTITTDLTVPACATQADAGSPSFDDGPVVQWTDDNGDNRAGCAYVPPFASRLRRVPLLVFLHGAQGSADDLYNHTLLRSKAEAEGFAVVSVQGRNLHWVGSNSPGAHWDQYYRDLGSPSTNPDVRTLDWVVDTMVARGMIDRRQIYFVGWSNGAFMSQLYGVARFTTATPGGNHVAAVAAYAGGDPFATFDASNPTCAASPYPHSALPILLAHRSCDALVGCDQAQQAKFSLQPGYDVEDWRSLAATSAGLADPTVSDLIITATGARTGACLTVGLCGSALGVTNHVRWPDGVEDGSKSDWEPTMLDFLGSNPRSSP